MVRVMDLKTENSLETVMGSGRKFPLVEWTVCETVIAMEGRLDVVLMERKTAARTGL